LRLVPAAHPNTAIPDAMPMSLGHVLCFMHEQVQLPASMKVVEVGLGYVVLRAHGLYDAKITLVPASQPPLAPASSSAGSKAAAAAAVDDAVGDDEVTSGPPPVSGGGGCCSASCSL
jgi:hypothetical protein